MIPGEPVTSIGLRFETSVVRVTSTDPDDLVWLAAFLQSGFELVDPIVHEDQVELTVDPVAHDALLRRGRPDDGPPREGFSRDSGLSTLERWSSDGAGELVRDPKLPGFYRLSDSPRRVEILTRERTPRCRTALMRVVRELTMDRVVSTGGVLIHGAAVRSEHGVIALSGPKQRGKTTLLLSLLESTDVAYVSNDRCVLRVEAGAATLRGLPTIVSIRRESLATLPRFRERLFVAHPHLAARDRPRLGLAPHELLGLFPSRRHASSGRASAFLFPEVVPSPVRPSLRRLSEADALDRFRQGLFRAGHPTVLGDVFASDATRGPAPWRAAETAGRWVSENLPCFRLELGTGLPPTATECRSLLARATKPVIAA